MQQGLARGHHVQALPRHPETSPLRDDRLDAIAGSTTDPAVIDAAVAAADAVVCTIGTASTRRPVQVRSTSACLLVDFLRHHRRQRMEPVLSTSDLEWTVVRPPGLTRRPGTGYATARDRTSGPFTSRDDLSAALLDQLDDDRCVRAVAAVTTPGLRVSGWHVLRHEVLER